MSPNVASAPLTPFPSCRDSVRPPAPGTLPLDSLQHCSHDPVHQGFQFARRRHCWRDRVGLFVRRVWCSGREFLEARIIPERIEHRIEPEQRGRERDARSK